MNDVSSRLLLNIVHGHLSAGLRHDADCRDRCAAGCGWVVLEEWLAGPVTRSDQLADERFELRKQALLRGEIPT